MASLNCSKIAADPPVDNVKYKCWSPGAAPSLWDKLICEIDVSPSGIAEDCPGLPRYGLPGLPSWDFLLFHTIIDCIVLGYAFILFFIFVFKKKSTYYGRLCR